MLRNQRLQTCSPDHCSVSLFSMCILHAHMYTTFVKVVCAYCVQCLLVICCSQQTGIVVSRSALNNEVIPDGLRSFTPHQYSGITKEVVCVCHLTSVVHPELRLLQVWFWWWRCSGRRPHGDCLFPLLCWSPGLSYPAGAITTKNTQQIINYIRGIWVCLEGVETVMIMHPSEGCADTVNMCEI